MSNKLEDEANVFQNSASEEAERIEEVTQAQALQEVNTDEEPQDEE